MPPFSNVRMGLTIIYSHWEIKGDNACKELSNTRYSSILVVMIIIINQWRRT